MPIKILREESYSQPVKVDLLISTIETNRDRVRTIGNMLITASGILIPACLSFIIFFVDKGYSDTKVLILLAIAILLFLISSCLSIISSFLRKSYTILDEVQFIEDLIENLNKEIKISLIAFLFLIVGMIIMVIAVFVFAIEYWR
jgi:hypothetical protein